MSDQQGTTTAAASPRRGGKKKWIILAIVVVVPILIVLMVPTIAGSAFGRGRITSAINQSISGSVEIESLSASWFGSQTLTGLVLKDPHGNAVANIDRVSVDASLLSLATGGRDLGEVNIQGLTADVLADATGSNLQRAITPTTESEPSQSTELPVTGRIIVTDAQLSLTQSDNEPVHVSDLNVNVDLATDKPIAFELSAKTAQGELRGGIDGSGSYDLASEEVIAKANVDKLPLAGVDALLGTGGILEAAIGKQMDITIDATSQGDTHVGQIAIASPQLNGRFDLQTVNDQIVIDTKQPAVWVMSQQFIKTFYAGDPQLQSLALRGDVPVSITLHAATAADGFAAHTTSIAANLTVADGTLAGDESIGTLTWSGLSGTILSESLQHGGTLSLKGNTTMDGRPGSVAVQAVVAKPFNADSELDLSGADIDAIVETTNVRIATIDRLVQRGGDLVELLGPSLDLRLTAKKTTDSPTTFSGQLRVAADSKLANVLSDQITLGGSAQFTRDASGQPSETKLNLALISSSQHTPLERLSIAGTIDPDYEQFNGESALRYRLMPDKVGSGDGEPTLARPADVQLLVKDAVVPLRGFSLDAIAAQIELRVEQVELAGDPRFAGMTARDLSGSVTLAPDQPMRANLTAATNVPGAAQPGSIKINAALDNWTQDGAITPANTTGNATVELTDVPTAFVDAFIATGGKLPTYIGDQVDVTLTFDGKNADRRNIVASVTSENLKASASGHLTADNRFVPDRKVIPIEYKLTPAAYAAWVAGENGAPPPMALVSPITVTATIQDLPTIPLDGPIDPRDLSFNINFNATDAFLRNTSGRGEARISNLAGSLNSERLAGGAVAKLTGKIDYANPQAQQNATGNLDVSGSLSDLFDQTGQLSISTASADITAKLGQIPVAPLDQIINAENKLHALLGDTAQLDIIVKMVRGTGPVRLIAQSPNTRALLVGRVQDGVIVLDQDGRAEIIATRELGRHVLRDVNFMLESVYSSKQPIRVTIPKDGFRLPLDNPTVAGLQAQGVVVELGTLRMENRGPLALLMKFARRSNPQQSDAQFTPLVFSIKDGKLHYDRRLDMLVDGSFHAVMFGDVNLVTQQLDMRLGLPPQTLDKAFNIENVPPNYVYQIPALGPITKPDIDYVKAGIELGAMSASGSANSEVGLAIGIGTALLNKDKGPQAKDKPVPPPSQDPLPWVNQLPVEQPDPQPQQPAQQQPRQPTEEEIKDALIREGLKRLLK